MGEGMRRVTTLKTEVTQGDADHPKTGASPPPPPKGGRGGGGAVQPLQRGAVMKRQLPFRKSPVALMWQG